MIEPKFQAYEFGQNALAWTVWREDPLDARDSLWYDRDGALVRWKTLTFPPKTGANIIRRPPARPLPKGVER